MSAKRRTPRDRRRRRLGQNFLRPELAELFVAEANVGPGDLVLDLGAGAGSITMALARCGCEVVAVEIDPVWADALRERVRRAGLAHVHVTEADVLSLALPAGPFRVVASLPFGSTTGILHHLLDDPRVPLVRADLVVQWEVARKRGVLPPSTLLSASWSPWWEFRLGSRIPAREFRPVPTVDAGVLVVTRREPPVLPVTMASAFAEFVRVRWPFDHG